MGSEDSSEEHHDSGVSIKRIVVLQIITYYVYRYDTYHDTLHKSKSVGALVASINSSFTRFVSSANLHEGPAQELSNTMKPGVTKALRKYSEVNGCLPDRVFMYR